MFVPAPNLSGLGKVPGSTVHTILRHGHCRVILGTIISRAGLSLTYTLVEFDGRKKKERWRELCAAPSLVLFVVIFSLDTTSHGTVLDCGRTVTVLGQDPRLQALRREPSWCFADPALINLIDRSSRSRSRSIFRASHTHFCYLLCTTSSRHLRSDTAR